MCANNVSPSRPVTTHMGPRERCPKFDRMLFSKSESKFDLNEMRVEMSTVAVDIDESSRGFVLARSAEFRVVDGNLTKKQPGICARNDVGLRRATTSPADQLFVLLLSVVVVSMDPKMANAGETPDEKAHQYIYRPSDLTAAEAAKAPGGMDFIGEKNKIDETYHLPVNASRKSTWCVPVTMGRFDQALRWSTPACTQSKRQSSLHETPCQQLRVAVIWVQVCNWPFAAC